MGKRGEERDEERRGMRRRGRSERRECCISVCYRRTSHGSDQILISTCRSNMHALSTLGSTNCTRLRMQRSLPGITYVPDHIKSRCMPSFEAKSRLLSSQARNRMEPVAARARRPGVCVSRRGLQPVGTTVRFGEVSRVDGTRTT